MSENIILKHYNELVTTDSSKSYRIVDGKANIFIAPVINDNLSRRIYLCTLNTNDVIPSIASKYPLNNPEDVYMWNLIIVPEESVEIEETSKSPDDLKSFAKHLNLKEYEKENVTEDTVIEIYRMTLAVNLRNIYSSNRETQNARKNTVRRILETIEEKSILKSAAHSSNPLYDCVSLICVQKDIEIVDFDILKKNYGSRFTIQDIARLSNFPFREVILTNDWFKSDMGELLVYSSNNNAPMVALPLGRNGYKLYNPQTGEIIKVTPEIAASVSAKAITIYRTLPTRKNSLFDVFKFALKEVRKRDYAFIICLALIGTLIGILLPVMNQQIFDNYIPLSDINGMVGIGVVILSCMLGNVVFTMINQIAQFRVSSRMRICIDSSIVARLFNMENQSTRNLDTADIVTRTISINQAISFIMTTIFTEGLGLVLSLVYLITMNSYAPKLTSAALLMCLGSLVILVWVGFSLYKYSSRKAETDNEIASKLYQFIAGINKLKMTKSEDRAVNNYIQEYSKSVYYNRRIGIRNNISVVVLDSVKLIFSMVIFYIMVRKSVSISIGEYMGFNSAFGAFSGAFLSLGAKIVQVFMFIPILKRARVLLDSEVEFDEEQELPGQLEGNIDIDNVSFKYEEDGPLVLDGINLHIKKGEYLGIVGTSGCGKTTLLKILLGFENPTEGKIYYDGKDLEKLNKSELRKKTGTVLQGGALISGSIYDNITITNHLLTKADVESAIDRVGLKEVIDNMPMGLNTPVSNEMCQVSGGQKQRILIARAIVNNPAILFFDEATSALDNVAQNQICESLDKLNTTRVVIAHRLSTIINCDRIIVMDDGKIAEEGSYEELMKLDGIFAKLSKRQM